MKKLILFCIVCFFMSCSSENNKNINDEQKTLNEMKQSLDTTNVEFVLERDTTS